MERVLEGGTREHLLQLYGGDERLLATSVGRYLSEGLIWGDALLIIATKAHRKAFARQLRSNGYGPQAVMREGRLAFLDSEATLARFMLDGQPDWDRFQSTIGTAVRDICRRWNHGKLRAYGDMAGMLWEGGQFSPAIRLEQFWNRLVETLGFSLYCAYPIDVFGGEFHMGSVGDLLCAHSRLVPTGPNGDIENALRRAMDETLATKVQGLLLNGNRQPSNVAMPSAEAAILSLRASAPGYANEVVPRARRYYQSEKRFRALIENSSDAVSLIDAKGKILYASASTTRVLGYWPEEIVGRSVFEFIHPDDVDEVTGKLREVLAKKATPIQVQARVLRKDATYCWVESTSSNLLDAPDVAAIVFNYRDISERKAAEEKRQRDAEQLARTNEELQAFAYAAAHDLKEPLRTVCAYTELLMRTAGVGDDSKEIAGYIVEGVSRMSGLLDDLLSFTRLEVANSPENVPLDQAAREAIRNLAGAIRESGAAITVDPLPVVRGSAGHLVQLFQNLISNAIKYRSESPVEIRINAEASRQIRSSLSPERGQDWIVTVKDNGIGIPRQYHEQVFGIFKRLHGREVPGSGIGLAICRKIVEGIGGRIWVESEPGKGSSFCFTIRGVEAGANLAVPGTLAS